MTDPLPLAVRPQPPVPVQSPGDAADPLARWHEARSAATTAAQRAAVAAAARAADAAMAELDTVATVHAPASTHSLIALHTYQALHDSGAVAHPTGTPTNGPPLAPAAHAGDLPTNQDQPTARCTAEPDAVRDWLTGPAEDPDSPDHNVADMLGIDDFLGVDAPDVNPHLTRLFEAGQAAGVFGVAGHTVELWHVTDDEGAHDGHLIVARRADGIGPTPADPAQAAVVSQRRSR